MFIIKPDSSSNWWTFSPCLKNAFAEEEKEAEWIYKLGSLAPPGVNTELDFCWTLYILNHIYEYIYVYEIYVVLYIF